MKSAYHSILVGKLVQLFPHQRSHIFEVLPKESLGKMIELIEDFAIYHEAIQSYRESKELTRQSLDEILALLRQ
jgi:hypothetical protein